MCKFNEVHYLNVEDSDDYQLLHEDAEYGDTKIYGKFEWQGSAIIKINFILINKANSIRHLYKMHRANFCQSKNRIELHLSSDKSFTSSIDQLDTIISNNLTLAKQDRIDFCLRITSDSQTSNTRLCENDTSGDPDDKDGSILIGT